MKRDALMDLNNWKDSVDRRPLILRGARQVGKTWLVRELGKEFSNFVELNFEEFPQLAQFFTLDLNPERILKELSIYSGDPIIPGETLLFFDEVQAEPKALAALRYFYEKVPDLHIIAAGSLIEFELEKISFPVGRVEFYYVYPMSFGEFLETLNRTSLRDLINSQEKIGNPLHVQLLELFRDYMILGGMPSVLARYSLDRNIDACRRIQTLIIETYLADFSKYARTSQVKYLQTVFTNIPIQLGRKYKYTNVSTLYKSRDLRVALDLLEKASLVHKVYHTSANGIPLAAEQDDKKFKVIFFDTGLVLNLLNIPLKELFGDYDISLVNEGALAVQIIGQELIGMGERNRKPHLHYWHREAKSSNAEVDYLITKGREIIPIEVKRGVKGRIRSLNMFLQEKGNNSGIVVSSNPISNDGNIEYIPFYRLIKVCK